MREIPVRLRHAYARSEARRVWLFTLPAGDDRGRRLLDDRPSPRPIEAPIHPPWPVLAAGFFAAEAKVIVVHFRRESHSFSLSEIPAVAGLFFFTPDEYMASVLDRVGRGDARHVARRRPSRSRSTSRTSRHRGRRPGDLPLDRVTDRTARAVDWLAAFAATLSASVVCVFAIATAISLSGGAPQFQKLPEMVRFGAMVALANTSLALLAVTVMWIEPTAVWLLVVPLVTMFLAYGAYVSEREKHERLELLYQSSRILQHSPELDSALVALLDHARDMFRAELDRGRPAGPRRRGGVRTTSFHGAPPEVMVPVAWDPADPITRPPRG